MFDFDRIIERRGTHGRAACDAARSSEKVRCRFHGVVHSPDRPWRGGI